MFSSTLMAVLLGLLSLAQFAHAGYSGQGTAYASAGGRGSGVSHCQCRSGRDGGHCLKTDLSGALRSALSATLAGATVD